MYPNLVYCNVQENSGLVELKLPPYNLVTEELIFLNNKLKLQTYPSKNNSCRKTSLQSRYPKHAYSYFGKHNRRYNLRKLNQLNNSIIIITRQIYYCHTPLAHAMVLKIIQGKGKLLGILIGIVQITQQIVKQKCCLPVTKQCLKGVYVVLEKAKGVSTCKLLPYNETQKGKNAQLCQTSFLGKLMFTMRKLEIGILQTNM